jgi:ESCRT-II complex subunit VPS25
MWTELIRLDPAIHYPGIPRHLQTSTPISHITTTTHTMAPPGPLTAQERPSHTTTETAFQYPPHYSFPPFFTLQPVLTTRTSQLQSWSSLIQSYCRHHRIWSLSLNDALSTPLFSNTKLSRKLSLRDARAIIHWMTTSEGSNRAEWIGISTKKGWAKGDEGGDAAKAWIFWRRPEEWAAVLEEWVERTGQKGSVVTLYEITESDATRREEFFGMDGELLVRSLAVCVKRGKAQVFGQEGSEGVKFF